MRQRQRAPKGVPIFARLEKALSVRVREMVVDDDLMEQHTEVGDGLEVGDEQTEWGGAGVSIIVEGDLGRLADDDRPQTIEVDFVVLFLTYISKSVHGESTKTCTAMQWGTKPITFLPVRVSIRRPTTTPSVRSMTNCSSTCSKCRFNTTHVMKHCVCVSNHRPSGRILVR